MSILRANSRLASELGEIGLSFLDYATGAFERLLPHCQISSWKEHSLSDARAVWDSSDRNAINVTLSFSRDQFARSITATIRRRRVPRTAVGSWVTMDQREHKICKLIVERISHVLRLNPEVSSRESLSAIQRQFDEDIVVSFLKDHHPLELDISQVFESLHRLAEQTYENTPLAFGCLLDPGWRMEGLDLVFPDELLRSKKYRALSDGYKTAYHVSTNGCIMHFICLEGGKAKGATGRNFFPYWARYIASRSRDGCCGVALTTHGDILVFDEGNLTFSYRFGRWQVWNHGSYCSLIRDLVRGGTVPLSVVGAVAKAVYQSSIDASFRRKGALFLVLSNTDNCSKAVRPEDRYDDLARDAVDQQFDIAIGGRKLQNIPREIVSELASLDGAIVVNRSGDIQAYGAVLRPKKQGELRGSEGSRTKAAIGASNYGVSVKVSSDGEITIFSEGKQFLGFGAGAD